MCGKRLLALLLALLLAVCLIRGDAFGQADRRPVLVLWTADWCSYCRDFERQLQQDQAFRAAILGRYRIVRRNWDRERAVAYLSGVWSIPAFLGQDGRRSIGFTGPARLLRDLRIPHGQLQPRTAPQQTQPAGPRAGTSGPARPAASADELDGLRQQLVQQAEQLERWQQSIGEHLQQRDDQATEQAEAARLAAAQLAADVQATRDELARLQAEQRPVADLTGGGDLPQADSVAAGDGKYSRSDAGHGNDNQPARPRGDGEGPWNWVLPVAAWIAKRKALSAGLSIGGPIGAAVIGGGWLLRRWRGRQSSDTTAATAGQPGQRKPTEPAWATMPAVPDRRCTACDQLRQRLDQQQQAATAEQSRLRAELDHTAARLEQATAEGLQTQTRYVRVPVADPEGEMFREAIRRVAGLRPADVGLLNLVEDTARQLLHGHRVKSQAGGPPDAKPGIWSDSDEKAVA